MVLPSDSYAADNSTTQVQPFKSNMPQTERILNFTDTKPSKQYLTAEEIKSIDVFALNAIYEEVQPLTFSKSEDEINQIVAEKIKNHQPVSRAKAAADEYYIPVFGKINSAEIKLATSNPFEFTIYSACAVTAWRSAENYYGGNSLYQGNGDAYRHSYWNDSLVKRMGGTKGRDFGDTRAKIWTDAHEANSSGIDLEMDLHNNWIGRMLAYNNYSWSLEQYSNHLKNAVANGGMARIVNGQLVRTNGDRNN
ncbi:DUF6973 domain-containing protein [Bacillus cereus group sp. MYBK14-1]|uniref:DUF6973 domain-containing protein n=1 Tax=Bacillus cereus group sp. MYBK14-1 TaxID=3450682 RepID=UPI003F7A726E